MYLNLKLSEPGTLLFCVSLGPARTVPCSVGFQKFRYPAINLDSPFSPGCKNYLPYAQSSNNWKNISNSSKNWPCSPLGEPSLSHKSSLGSLDLLPGSHCLPPTKKNHPAALTNDCFPSESCRLWGIFLHLLTFPILINSASIKSSHQATRSLYLLPICKEQSTKQR